jgi:hypothetical protein
MNKLRVNRNKFSGILWDNIFEYSKPCADNVKNSLGTRAHEKEYLRNDAKYNTGSVSLDAMFALYSIAHFFKPTVVAEVGTFIGNSTYALALGMNNPAGELYTCDHSNDIQLESMPVPVTQYRHAQSSAMFKALIAADKKVDLMFFDGRLSADDMPLIGKLSTYDTVYVFDDFEGIEKGVSNVGMFMANSHTRIGYYLVYPPKNMNCTIAMLVPRKLVEWTDQ